MCEAKSFENCYFFKCRACIFDNRTRSISVGDTRCTCNGIFPHKIATKHFSIYYWLRLSDDTDSSRLRAGNKSLLSHLEPDSCIFWLKACKQRLVLCCLTSKLFWREECNPRFRLELQTDHTKKTTNIQLSDEDRNVLLILVFKLTATLFNPQIDATFHKITLLSLNTGTFTVH